MDWMIQESGKLPMNEQRMKITHSPTYAVTQLLGQLYCNPAIVIRFDRFSLVQIAELNFLQNAF